VLVATCANAELPAPVRFVEETAQLLVVAVKDAQPGLRGNYEKQRALLDAILRPRFDLEKSTALMLRSYWASATPREQQDLVEAFYRYLVRTYGDALGHVTDDTITIIADQPAVLADRYAVQTTLRLHDGERFEVRFYLQQKSEQWFVVDVIVEGVSYVRTYRTDFAPILRQDGIHGLIKWLDEAPTRKR
jgi:phospholipid transport system substrate-binding protein